ncbi:MAG TPA: hypothetical protein VNV14_05075 [Opitutaceae bacterium]|jgi:hypothetical protein|nr:hypothetical protein [Opitutaceae bacterium]
MKRLILFFILFLVPLFLRAEGFVVDRWINSVAEILQRKMPELSTDRLFEAKRGNAEWTYRFCTKADKTWVEEVRIHVRQKNAYSSDVNVEVVRLDGGLLWTTTEPEPAASEEWTAKIRDLLKK